MITLLNRVDCCTTKENLTPVCTVDNVIRKSSLHPDCYQVQCRICGSADFIPCHVYDAPVGSASVSDLEIVEGVE